MKTSALAAALAALAITGATAAQQAAPAANAIAERNARYEALYAQTNNHSILWLLAEGYAEAGERAKALDALRRVADLKMGFMPVADSRLQRYAADPEFQAVLERMKTELPMVGRARVAFTLPDRTVAPEGIAYDQATGRLFVGDARGRRILVVDRLGRRSVFVAATGLPVLGMTVDARARRLWVAATDAFWASPQPSTVLLAYDLATGRQVVAATSPEVRSLNDVSVAPNGDVWATDSLGGAVFRLKAGAGVMERVTPAGAMSYPNGLAATDDGRHVFVAQGASLRRIETATGAVLPLPAPESLTTLGIDGLYWRGGELIAVQNGGTAGRVLRLRLSAERDAITAFEVLEAGAPVFDIPTTGAVAGDRIYVLANAQLFRFKPDFSVDEAALAPFVVIETPL